MEKFKSFFLWSYSTKVGVSIWAMVITVINAFFGWLSGENSMSYLMIIQILALAFIIGKSFDWIFKKDEIKAVFCLRSFVWSGISFLSLVAFSFGFGWYSAIWCYVVMLPLMLIGMFVLVLGEKWQRERESK